MKSSRLILLVLLILACPLVARTIFTDSFENLSLWNTIYSEDVEITITSERDAEDQLLLRLDYNFRSGAGYCGIGRKIDLEFPDDYRFRFGLQGSGASNNLEFKLVDESGENVWWKIERNFVPPAERQEYIVRQREIEFAWGPAQDRTLRHSAEIQIIISSAEGGSGTLQLDNLVLESYRTLPLAQIHPTVKINAKETAAHGFFDGRREACRMKMHSRSEKIDIDLGGNVELGGLRIDWDSTCVGGRYRLRFSENGLHWTTALSDRVENTAVSWIRLKDREARFICLNLEKPQASASCGIGEIEFFPPEKAANMNRWLKNRVKGSPDGDYPRYLYDRASYWTVVGNVDDDQEVLINTDGQVETGNREFLLEPVILLGDEIATWADVSTMQTLASQYLPIPAVVWHHPGFRLEQTVLVGGKSGESQLFIRYIFLADDSSTGKFRLALVGRPFQVNPDYQSLGLAGGFAPIHSIERNSNALIVNQTRRVGVKPGAGSIRLFDHQDGLGLREILRFQPDERIFVQDSLGLASFAVLYDLPPDRADTIVICVPLYENGPVTGDISAAGFQKALEETSAFWTEKLNAVRFELPTEAAKLINTYRSNLAYILINRDGNGIQPGSRSYERSWIRDGSLTSSALMKGGLFSEPRAFIEWFGSFQFESGKIPCVIDRRGPDPVPENDSHGQYIFAVAEYYRFTQDRAFIEEQYPNVQRAVNYIDRQRSLRRTDFYQSGGDSLRCLYGLMPESISHEGYMDKPRHSYWDDFFTLKGLKDAVMIAGILDDCENAKEFGRIRDEFTTDFYNSIDCSRDRHGIDYIPGCAELGDFDATSTTIGLWPAGEWENMLKHGGRQTFERYLDFHRKRRTSSAWQNYTPYELRTAGSFLYMGLPAVSLELLDFFFEHQRPEGWNHWAEVINFDPDTARFIGDMPHTWVGSDYINAFRSFFAFEDPETDRLVLAAGIPHAWIQGEEGVAVTDFPTHYGRLSYRIQDVGDKYKFTISSLERVPAGGIVIPGYSLIYPENAYRTSQAAAPSHTDIVIHEISQTVYIEK